jgi:hypothetical protein
MRQASDHGVDNQDKLLAIKAFFGLQEAAFIHGGPLKRRSCIHAGLKIRPERVWFNMNP